MKHMLRYVLKKVGSQLANRVAFTIYYSLLSWHAGLVNGDLVC
jgi:hypothetical protein